MKFLPTPGSEHLKLKNALIADWLGQIGFRVISDKHGNLMAVHENPGADSRFDVYNFHSDVVGGGPTPKKVNGKIYGRGAVDNTGNLAAFLKATSDLKNASQLGNLIVVCDVEEESPTGLLEEFLVELKKTGVLNSEDIRNIYVIEPFEGNVAYSSAGSYSTDDSLICSASCSTLS